VISKATFIRLACAAGFTLAVTAGASAQNAGESRENYEDWQVYCAVAGAGGKQECEMRQLLQNQEGKLAAGMYLARRGGQMMMMVRVPLGVALNKNMMLQLGSGIGTDALTFTRCDTGGCIAQMAVSEGFLNSLRGAKDMTLTLYADASTPITRKFSMKGFPAAEKALSAKGA
jgi:invasion protein IalB